MLFSKIYVLGQKQILKKLIVTFFDIYHFLHSKHRFLREQKGVWFHELIYGILLWRLFVCVQCLIVKCGGTCEQQNLWNSWTRKVDNEVLEERFLLTFWTWCIYIIFFSEILKAKSYNIFWYLFLKSFFFFY